MQCDDDFDRNPDARERLKRMLKTPAESLGQRQTPRRRRAAWQCQGQKQGRRGPRP
jgi:hypothetical protein